MRQSKRRRDRLSRSCPRSTFATWDRSRRPSRAARGERASRRCPPLTRNGATVGLPGPANLALRSGSKPSTLLGDISRIARHGRACVKGLTISKPGNDVVVLPPDMNEMMRMQVRQVRVLFEHRDANVWLPPPLKRLAKVPERPCDKPLPLRIRKIPRGTDRYQHVQRSTASPSRMMDGVNLFYIRPLKTRGRSPTSTRLAM